MKIKKDVVLPVPPGFEMMKCISMTHKTLVYGQMYPVQIIRNMGRISPMCRVYMEQDYFLHVFISRFVKTE